MWQRPGLVKRYGKRPRTVSERRPYGVELRVAREGMGRVQMMRFARVLMSPRLRLGAGRFILDKDF